MDQVLQDKIWNFHQNENKDSFLNNRARLLFLLSLIGKKIRKSPADIKILNIGIGDGFFEELAKIKGFDFYSVDPNIESLEELYKKLLGNSYKLGNGLDKFKKGYIQDIPFATDFFDVVVVSEVLEHLEEQNMLKGLDEINRVLNNGGLILGTVPARENLNELVVVCPNCQYQFHHWGHVQSFSIRKVRSLLKRNFTTISVSEKYFMPINLNWKGKIFSYFKLLFSKLNFHGSGEKIIFSAFKSFK